MRSHPLSSFDSPPPSPNRETSAPADRANSWNSWNSFFDSSRIQFSRYNPSGLALRTALAPGVPTVSEQRGVQRLALASVLGNPVDARLHPSRATDGRKRLIIGFHGNGTTADGMASTWHDLSRYGRVLAVNMPGYGHTPAPDNGALLELHMAAGVQAAADYATQELGLSPDQITWYGLSLGGTQAAIGFSMLPGSHMVLHNTLTGPSAVAAEVLERQVGSWRSVAKSVAAAAAWGAFPLGLERPGLRYVTDGLDTLGKLRCCHTSHRPLGSRLFVVGAERDELMAPTFPRQLWEAFYGDDPAAQNCLYVIPGAGHNAPIAGTAAVRLDGFFHRAG